MRMGKVNAEKIHVSKNGIEKRDDEYIVGGR